MREIISIDKDFLNNKETITTKQKPKSRAKGKVTVSLFDEKGNKQREIKTENIVYDWVKAYSFKNNYFTNFGLGTMGGQNSAKICTDSYTGTMPLSKYLMLFNGDHEDTNPRKSLIKDELIGYAGRYENYSGSDVLKGTYNSAESKTSIDEEGNIVFHMVYDFPTHAANGNITGVGLGCTINRNSDIVPYRAMTFNNSTYGVNEYITSISTNKDCDFFKGVFIGTSSASSSYICCATKSLSDILQKKQLPSSINLKTLTNMGFTSSVSCRGYGGINDNTDELLMSYNFTTPVDIAKGVAYNAPVQRMGNNLKAFARVLDKDLKQRDIEVTLGYDFTEILNLKESSTVSYVSSVPIYMTSLLHIDKFIVYVKPIKTDSICNDIKASSYIFIFDLEGNYEKHLDISSLTTKETLKIIPYGEDEFLLSIGSGAFVKGNKELTKVEKVDIDQLNLNNKDKINLGKLRSLSYNLFIGNYNTKCLYACDTYNSYESNYKLKDDRINLSSYTRLPSPVVKTNVHTMKVQYDLVIEDVSVYDYIEY